MQFPTRRTLFATLALVSLTATAAAAGCSGGDNASSGSGGSGNGAAQGSGSGTGGSGTGGDIGFIDAGSNDGALNPDSACASQSSEATLVKKPVDIIIVIDNSGSMTEEITGVQKNINENFAQIIEQSGLDYRVIMVTRHGSAASGQSVCIEAPLSGIPAGGCTPPPAQPKNNPPRFFHYSVEVASRDSWCKLLSTYAKADEFNLAPMGWKDWLRPDAYKIFIEVSDDGVGCTLNNVTYTDNNTAAGGTAAATKFDKALLALDPAQFGTEAERNYTFYSIIGMAYNNPADKPWEPADPIQTGKCPTGANNGTGHQALSQITGALRFPLCDTTSYDVVFKAIAQGVIKGAKASCDFPVPPPPMGQSIDLKSVVVEYTPGDMSPPQQFAQVADAASCAAGSFYIDTATKTISLCPDTCAVVQKDAAAKVNVLFACDPGGAN
jgi:hypothetical protein